MRRQLHNQVVFKPARLSDEHLHNAYALVVPIVERQVQSCMDRRGAAQDQQPQECGGSQNARKEGVAA